MAGSQSLFDALSAASGHDYNRQGVEASVANSQAINGLRSAQTDVANLNAQKAQEEQFYRTQLESAATSLLNGDATKGHAAAVAMRAGTANWKDAFNGLQEAQRVNNTATVSDPTLLGTAAQTGAFQGLNGKPNDFRPVPENYAVSPGEPPPQVQESPLGAAHAASLLGSANLHNVQARAGGFNPNAAGGALHLSDPEMGAISQAAHEGRVDPTRINSRNAHIVGSMLLNNPGINLNRLGADAALQRNAIFQQRAMTMDAMPEVLAGVTAAGKKLDFSGNKWIGDMQGWVNGVNNDPDMTEYMTRRNDALMTIAGVMRGVGMSDKAHQAEIEAMHPTMSGPAMDAWFHAQMGALGPRLKQQHRVTDLGGAASPMAVTPQNPATQAPAAPGQPNAADPLGIRGH